jgi:hypothetical protein
MEQEKGSAKPSNPMVEPDVKRELARSTTAGKIPELVKTVDKTTSYAEAAQGKLTEQQEKEIRDKETVKGVKKTYTNQEFLDEKLANCKKFVNSISILQGTTLAKTFETFTAKDVLEWVIWMKKEGKPIDSALGDLFNMHKLQITSLKPEEFEKIKLYFLCFQTLATKVY